MAKNETKKDFITADEELNVAKIMQDIEQRIAEKKSSGVLKDREVEEIEEMELQPLPDFLEIPNVYEPHLYPQHQPEEINLDFHTIPEEPETGLYKKIMGKIRKILNPWIRFMIRPYIREAKTVALDAANSNLTEIGKLMEFNKKYEPMINQSKDYIKLIHNCTNNVIVELTKLKIEEETLKTKIKTMEDKIAFLEKRERAIEKKVFK